MKKYGSVLLFSMMVMGVLTVLTQQLIKNVSVGSAFSTSMVAREQSEMLAFGGLQLAYVQLDEAYNPQKKAGTDKKKKSNFWPLFVQQVLPVLGLWQDYELQSEFDGIDGKLSICITCEEGKFPIKALIDQKKGQLHEWAKKALNSLSVKKELPAGALVQKIEAFFKKQKAIPHDITGFAPVLDELSLPLFYEPLHKPEKKKISSDDDPVKLPALQDLFSLWNSSGTLSPLLLSDSVRMMLGIRRANPLDPEKRKDRYEELGKGIEAILSKPVDAQWRALQKIYDAKPKLSKELQRLFSSEIEPRFFSVLSSSTVREVSQTILAVIEVVDAPQKQKKERVQSKESTPQEKKKEYVIRQLYWL